MRIESLGHLIPGLVVAAAALVGGVSGQERPDPKPAKELFDPGRHLKLVGTFRLPRDVAGKSTGFCAGVLAMRTVGGEARLLSDSSNGDLYEVRVPARFDGNLVAEIVAAHGQALYGGKKVGNAVNGLLWREEDNALYWASGIKYNTERKGEPVVGRTTVRPGAWGVTRTELVPLPRGVNNLWCRGGVLFEPGGTLLQGFGGYYSIIAGGSWGPCLVAPDGRAWLGYQDHPSEDPARDHRCSRPGDYRIASPGWMGRDPASGQGTWTGADEVGGEDFGTFAHWFDADGLAGVVFVVSQGTGRIGYDAGHITSEGRANRVYVYDPTDVRKARDKKLKPHEPTPRVHDLKPPPGLRPVARAAGGAYDPKARLLYLCWARAWRQDVEDYPTVAVYRVGR